MYLGGMTLVDKYVVGIDYHLVTLKDLYSAAEPGFSVSAYPAVLQPAVYPVSLHTAGDVNVGGGLNSRKTGLHKHYVREFYARRPHSGRLFLFARQSVAWEAEDMPATKKHLRLIMPPGIGFALRSLALKEGRSESAMAVRLIAEAIDARNVAAQSQPEDLRRFLSVLALAAKSTAEPASVA
jgi:hypothetical protein